MNGTLVPRARMRLRTCPYAFGTSFVAGGALPCFGHPNDSLPPITPSEASTLASILETRRRVIETQDLEKRIAKLEKANSGPTDRAA